MRNHPRRYRKEEQEGDSWIVQNTRCLQAMHRIGHKVQSSPPAGDQSVRERSKADFSLHDTPNTEHADTHGKTDSQPTDRSKLCQRIAYEKRNSNNQQKHADLIEPTPPNHGLQTFLV